MNRRIAILGSTGSIGTNALAVIEHLGAPYRATALAANRNTEKLIEQALRYKPAAIAVADESRADEVASKTKSIGAKFYAGAAGVAEMVSRDDIDIVLTAIVGAAGLGPALAAVKAGKTLALANKESLVIAGSLLVPLAKCKGVQILPVDSEHSAIFQAMRCGHASEIKRVILTASGGPFRKTSKAEMDRATLQDALSHPTWQMGSKITIDSATMFNKALEIIEACWLFDLPPEKIDVVIHPESIVHSIVEFVDGSMIAQMSPPDMRTPIQYALTYPDRAAGCGKRLDFSKTFSLNFEPPDPEKFIALRLAYEVAKTRGTSGAILNASNEVAVNAFIAGRIRFGMISRVVENTIKTQASVPEPTLEDLLAADHQAREAAENFIINLAGT